MPSSISSSDRGAVAARGVDRRAKRGAVLLLSALALTVASVELIARIGFDRLSRLQQRMQEERALAMQMSGHGSARPTMLVVGNSIAERGIDVRLLAEALSPRLRAGRYVVEGTTYFDWYYGLRRMFREGMRPSYVLMGFSAPHLNASQIRGDYSAYYLFDRSGVIEYARQAGLDLTTTSSLFFAHYSSFYAARSEIRAFLMNKMFPAYAAALHKMTVRPAPNETEEHIALAAAPRLQALRELSEEYGAQFLFAVIPTPQPGEDGLVAAGRMSRTTVLLPLRRRLVNASDFADDLHLNAAGRAMFTNALALALRNYLSESAKKRNP